jgi:hypothetical protein
MEHTNKHMTAFQANPNTILSFFAVLEEMGRLIHAVGSRDIAAIIQLQQIVNLHLHFFHQTTRALTSCYCHFQKQ